MSMTRVVMKQQMSGTRPDGREWPPVDVEFEVDAEEARFLTRTADGSSTPLAVYAEKRTETADAPEKVVETREDKAVKEEKSVKPAKEELDSAGFAKGGYVPRDSKPPGGAAKK